MILFTLAGFSQQVKTKTVALDNTVSINLPVDFHKIDTLGQQTYTANAEYGYIIVSRMPNPSTNKTLKKEKDLNNVFKEYIRKVQGSLKEGNITDDHDTIINKLEMHDFVLRTDTGSGVQLRKFRILYTKPVTYTFQYLYDEARQDVAAKEMNVFFANIKSAPSLDGTDQFTTFGKSQGISSTTIVLVISGLAIILFIIIMVRKKRRHDMLINDILGK
jgi:LPXTG-motif cell wall-anchored protein